MHKTTQKTLIGILRALMPWALFCLLLFLTLKGAHAQSYLGDEWNKYLNDVPGFAPTGQTGEELAVGFIRNLVRIVRNIVGAVALIMGVIYGLRLVIGRGQEEVITKQKTNFLYALMGFLILIISENVAGIFNPERATSEALIDFEASRDQLRDIANYIKWMLGSVIVLFGIISAFRMISAQGKDEEITKQKNNLTWSGIGMLFILLANNIVNAIYVVRSPRETSAASPDTAIGELTGVIRLILVFIGPVAIAFTIYAGFMYLTALDNEERATKAKRMIVMGIVAITTIYGAYAVVNTITSADLALINPFLV